MNLPRERIPIFKGLSIFWTIWFVICVVPYSTLDGLSINYLFALTPIYLIMSGKGIYKLPNLLVFFLILLAFIYVVGLVYQVDYYKHFERRGVSFVVFVLIFSLPLININRRIENAFYMALILFSLYSSIAAIGLLFGLDLVSDAIQAKNDIGTQRIGYIYLFAMWIIIYQLTDDSLISSLFEKLLLWIGLGVIVIGLFLTFSRASIVSLGFGAFVFSLIRLRKFFRFNISNLTWILAAVAFVYAFYYLIVIEFPTFAEFIDVRLISPFLSGEMQSALSDSDSSEGTRVAIWGGVIDFVISNPWTGSGFLGSWVLSDQFGSAHNQFIDTLLRIGFLGFGYYVYTMVVLGSFLYRHRQPLFVGFMAVIVYGMFHETYKDSQGAFVLSFLLAIYSTHYRQIRIPHPEIIGTYNKT